MNTNDPIDVGLVAGLLMAGAFAITFGAAMLILWLLGVRG